MLFQISDCRVEKVFVVGCFASRIGAFVLCYKPYYVGCLCSPRFKMGAVCSSLYPQMHIFQLLTRFRCIKFSFLLEGIFLSPIVLIVFNKNGPIRMQSLSVCQEGSEGS